MDWSQAERLLPIGIVLATAVVIVLVDLLGSPKDRYILPWLSLTGVLVAGAAIGLDFPPVWFVDFNAQQIAQPLILGGAFSVDGFGVLIWAVACGAGVLAIVFSSHRCEDVVLTTGEYYGLILLAVAGMMLLAVAHELLTLLISLEIMSVSTYILAGGRRDDPRSNEAALKYLILGAFSTTFLLLGIAFYYGAFGTLSLLPASAATAATPAGAQSLAPLALGLIFVGVLFKIGATPFHFWIPDVYEGAPTPVTGLMAVGVKAAAIAVFTRFAFETFGLPAFRTEWLPLMRIGAILTMIVGNVLAIRQDNVKRMLAYSGIAHTGYLLLAFLVPANAPREVLDQHLHGVLFYLIAYGVMAFGAFGVVSLVREDGRPLEPIEDYQGLAAQHPGLALCMAGFMVSLAGLPPLGGFFAKFLIFRDAIQQGEIIAAVIGILTSVVSLYYYLRVVVAMYMEPRPAPAEPAGSRCRYAWAVHGLIFASGVAILAIGIFPRLIYH